MARGFGRPRGLGVALRAAGLAEGGERGLGLLAEAVAVLERSQAPVELARALTDHGAALRRAGQRTRARAQLERGLDLAHHWGARRIAGQARAELIAAGAKPRRDAITGRDALTASELRVARLAAAGKSNREIAQKLFITTKTASAHLSRAYRKLDVTRRSQLAEALVSKTPAAGRQQEAARTRLRRRFPKARAAKDRDGAPDAALVCPLADSGHVDHPLPGAGRPDAKAGDMNAVIMERDAAAGRTPPAPAIPDLTLPRFVLGAAYRHGGKRALVDAATGQELSYAELADAVREVRRRVVRSRDSSR